MKINSNSEVKQKVVLTPEHKYWNEFESRLFKAINEQQTRCDNKLTNAKRILQTLPNIDVEGTLELLRELGGYCDCEVFVNVDENSWQDYINNLRE